MEKSESLNSHDAMHARAVSGDNICILDPAGQYQTGSRYSIASNGVDQELYNYEDHWEKQFGKITEITLWKVDFTNGDYTEDFKGTLTDLINFYKDTT